MQLRVFSFLSAAALEGGSAKQKERLVALLPVYGRVVGLAYKACADFLQSPGRLSEGAELLTRAFLVSRAALILASTPGPAGLISMYWLRVWPDLERLLYISLRDECKTSVSARLTWLTVAVVRHSPRLLSRPGLLHGCIQSRADPVPRRGSQDHVDHPRVRKAGFSSQGEACVGRSANDNSGGPFGTRRSTSRSRGDRATARRSRNELNVVQ